MDDRLVATRAPSGLHGLAEKLRATWLSNLARPVQAFRLSYLPLLLVYFAYGALGIIDVTRDMWIKEKLTLSPAELAGIAVWLSLPWTVKMVFGELVDSLPILGSQRRIYIIIGAVFTVRDADFGGHGRGMDRFRAARQPIRVGRDADRRRHRDPGRRGRCDVDRSGVAHRCRR
jgi:hypothetical protein